MIIAVIVIIVLGIICIVLGYGCYNVIQQNEALEEQIVFYHGKLSYIREQILQTEIQFKQIDIRGSFEADDEVGTTFKNLRQLHSELTDTIQSTYDTRNN